MSKKLTAFDLALAAKKGAPSPSVASDPPQVLDASPQATPAPDVFPPASPASVPPASSAVHPVAPAPTSDAVPSVAPVPDAVPQGESDTVPPDAEEDIFGLEGVFGTPKERDTHAITRAKEEGRMRKTLEKEVKLKDQEIADLKRQLEGTKKSRPITKEEVLKDSVIQEAARAYAESLRVATLGLEDAQAQAVKSIVNEYSLNPDAGASKLVELMGADSARAVLRSVQEASGAFQKYTSREEELLKTPIHEEVGLPTADRYNQDISSTIQGVEEFFTQADASLRRYGPDNHLLRFSEALKSETERPKLHRVFRDLHSLTHGPEPWTQEDQDLALQWGEKPEEQKQKRQLEHQKLVKVLVPRLLALLSVEPELPALMADAKKFRDRSSESRALEQTPAVPKATPEPVIPEQRDGRTAFEILLAKKKNQG